jgi:hypothetical protein
LGKNLVAIVLHFIQLVYSHDRAFLPKLLSITLTTLQLSQHFQDLAVNLFFFLAKKVNSLEVHLFLVIDEGNDTCAKFNFGLGTLCRLTAFFFRQVTSLLSAISAHKEFVVSMGFVSEAFSELVLV